MREWCVFLEDLLTVFFLFVCACARMLIAGRRQDDVVTKPFTVPDLMERIETLVDRSVKAAL